VSNGKEVVVLPLPDWLLCAALLLWLAIAVVVVVLLLWLRVV
jgi:hypothetical protein